MNEVLTVPTAFGDISDMAQGLVDRVDEQQIILYGPNPYDEGSELGFALLLLDGTLALEGRGVVAASVDGGEERDPSTRFDIIVQGLRFDGAAEVIFERMVSARLAMVDGAQAEELAEVPAAVEEEAGGLEGAEEAPSFDAMDLDNDEAHVAANLEDPEVPMPARESNAEPAMLEPAPEESSFEASSAELAMPAPESVSAPEESSLEASALDAEAQSDAEDADFAPPEERRGSTPTGAAEGGQRTYAGESREERASSKSANGLSQPPSRTFSQPPRGPESVAPTAADLEVQPGAAPPEPPPPPSGFSIDNSLSGGLVRPHTVWSPVAPPPPEPRPSSGLFQYVAGPIPIPDRPPRPELDPSFRVQRAPAPMREGEAPDVEGDARAARPARRQADFGDAIAAEVVEFDPVTADE